MNGFIPPKRKLLELLGLLAGGVVFYIVYPHFDGLILFCLGFIWNWAASNDVGPLVDNRRYRMSMLKLVMNLQSLVLKPFLWAPVYIKKVLKILPAGLFWSLVIYINDADMPWWPTFIGSALCEIVLIDFSSFRKPKVVS